MSMVHGGNIIATAKELGCRISDLVDMSSNLSPFAPAPDLLATLHGRLAEIAYLPETGSESLCALYAARHHLARDQVLVGNGTTEYIFSIPTVVDVKRGIIVNPTYSDYHLASARSGLETTSFPLRPAEGFQLDLDRLSYTLKGDELVFICNPNNPTGILVPTLQLHEFICTHPASRFLIDETYLPFIKENSLLTLPIPENLYILRSFSKIYGIPGLRLGFVVASTDNIQRLSSRQRPWGVNRLAQLAGEHLIQHGDDAVIKIADYVAKERPLFAAELEKLPGVNVVPGRAHFILGSLSGTVRAATLRNELLKHLIMIRNCASFTGLDDRYFRLSLKDEPANRKCIAALRKILVSKQTKQVNK
jgi:threonine-phosphate decarboxylase